VKRRTKIVLVIVALFVGNAVWQLCREDYGVGVASVWWLPRQACNITYLDNYVNRIAEFDIERPAFERWCARRKQPLRVLGNGKHATIHRCIPSLEQRGVLPVHTEPNEDLTAWGARVSKILGVGDLFYEERWPNGGGYTIGYDVKAGRGYYAWSHH